MNKKHDYKKECEELKKQLEEINKFKFSYRKDETKIPPIIRKQKDVEIIKNLENQQKEFINYLEDKIDICDGFLDTVKSDSRNTPYRVISSKKTNITIRIKENEIAHKVYKEILQKYKSIIGVLDEESNNISS